MAQQGYEVRGPNGERGWWDGKKITVLGSNGAPQKALRQGDQTAETGDIEAMQSANALSEQLAGYHEKIDGGKLRLSPVANAVNTVRNAVGASTDESRNYGSFKAGLEKMRNDSLRLNKGVQTEGDAQRAWNELIANTGDQEFVKQRLAEIQAIDDQAVRLRGQTINARRSAQGVDPLDTRQFTQGSIRKPFDLSGGQPRSTIPFGAHYIDPQGNLRRNDNGDAGNPVVRPAKNLGEPVKRTGGQAKTSSNRPSLDSIFGN
ncbi:hypothetical protein [Caulobacter sp. FWC2]|uniref:hypothetical protein n=1 Tax=Caulobacter sp. FWC2 TaxID=69664 RepID=UPI000C1502CF|nr:hypothetical protein [Caulobacter sp. FWC2]PIB91294.1 hypothetical protein CSW62_06715 [Caulobacter sp. FWC2]